MQHVQEKSMAQADSLQWAMMDGNEACAFVAYKVNEVIAIYPITPSSPMAEFADEWSTKGKKNVFGSVPSVVEMQSEAGAAAAVHGALQAGALATTFTASQGLLLMIPPMFKIAGELTPAVFHIAARTIATHALSIFGDHSDVMAVRSTGFAMLASASVQESMDLALISQAASLESRIPFLHFFDGFRTSHEVNKVQVLTDEQILAMLDPEQIFAHRKRALSPDRPFIRGTSQNPDTFFQEREAINPFYAKCPGVVEDCMERFFRLTGRKYRLFEYSGAPDADRVIVVMGSGAETVEETVSALNRQGERVGVVRVRLFRPFSRCAFLSSLPKTVRRVAVLDRTKEPGAEGEPLYMDVQTAIASAMQGVNPPFERAPELVGGRYGLSSKEFTPSMVKAVFDELKTQAPRHSFSVGIEDDVSGLSLPFDPEFRLKEEGQYSAMFYGLGSDGTVGASKNTIKIIGEDTPNYAQGYFVYDSKKAGSVTVSHLRFGLTPIRAPYLIDRADFISVSQFVFLDRFDMLDYAKEGGVFLLNTPFGPEEAWEELSCEYQEQILKKHLKLYVINAYEIAKEVGMGRRINTIMQACFFALSGILPKEDAIAAMKGAIAKTYGRKGEMVVQKNYAMIDMTLEHLFEVDTTLRGVSSARSMPPVVSHKAPEFVTGVVAPMVAGQGDSLPVSVFPVDGTFPTGTAKWEKRNLALDIPAWEMDLCIQCGKCAFVCPHAAIRIKAYEERFAGNAPQTFKKMVYKGKELSGFAYTIQVAAEDCTGCTLCVEVCPVRDKQNPDRKALNMVPQMPIRDAERENFNFFLELPEVDRRLVKVDTVKGSQFLEPLFEFSGACEGCGETPYLKLLTQLFGDRLLIGNATGCSSIYGGNLPTTPYTMNKEGRGPAWSNSLFEDAAEFALGFRLTIDNQLAFARDLLKQLATDVGQELAEDILSADQASEPGVYEQRQRLEALKERLKAIGPSQKVAQLLSLADLLVRKSVWGVGGDGWAYDIGYGGVDHVLASGRNINLLVMDTGVYSNTGGQMSKATPLGAVARFAASGKAQPRKDLALMAITYGSVYVAQIAMGANDTQTVKAFIEAERYDGPSIIIAYSHCIAHNIDMAKGLEHQKLAEQSGFWPLFRYNPKLAEEGKNPLILDSKPPKLSFAEFAKLEGRFRMLEQIDPDRAKLLLERAETEIQRSFAFYQHLASFNPAQNGNGKQETAKAILG